MDAALTDNIDNDKIINFNSSEKAKSSLKIDYRSSRRISLSSSK